MGGLCRCARSAGKKRPLQLLRRVATNAAIFRPGRLPSIRSFLCCLSLLELGRTDKARALFEDFKVFAECELETEAEIDYFATSLPMLLVFEDDLDE